ncbi:hypothetical protein [Nocardiopsis sp. CNT312]|uniref:hypothetical protein n=1 Tax=Nocardiopsis sp. CNT312 TaxID=1137268 RepID=UPI0004B7217B|nr:hypothetical protein [Nocardiopsis sp. CNT312]
MTVSDATRLAVRGDTGRTLHALCEADRVFDDLHRHLRGGGPRPVGWAPRVHGRDRSTVWFDTLSEPLRDHDARPTPRATADAAEVAWTALDDTLRAGGLLPEPWREARRS